MLHATTQTSFSNTSLATAPIVFAAPQRPAHLGQVPGLVQSAGVSGHELAGRLASHHHPGWQHLLVQVLGYNLQHHTRWCHLVALGATALSLTQGPDLLSKLYPTGTTLRQQTQKQELIAMLQFMLGFLAYACLNRASTPSLTQKLLYLLLQGTKALLHIPQLYSTLSTPSHNRPAQCLLLALQGLDCVGSLTLLGTVAHQPSNLLGRRL